MRVGASRPTEQCREGVPLARIPLCKFLERLRSGPGIATGGEIFGVAVGLVESEADLRDANLDGDGAEVVDAK